MNAEQIAIAAGTMTIAERVAAALGERGYSGIETSRDSFGSCSDVQTHPAMAESNQLLFRFSDGDDAVAVGVDMRAALPQLEGQERSPSLEEYMSLWLDSRPGAFAGLVFGQPACQLYIPRAMFTTAESCVRVVDHVELFASSVFDGIRDVLAGYSPAVAFARAQNRILSSSDPSWDLR